MSLSKMTDAEILAIVEPLMDNCLAGSTERDHACLLYTSDAADE